MSDSRGERVAVRIASGLALLLMLAWPVSLLPMIWTGDFRWVLTGFVLTLIGLFLGILIRTAGRGLNR